MNLDFDSDVPVSETVFSSQDEDVQKSIEILEEEADSMQPSFEKETLEAAAQVLRHEVLN